MEKQYIQQPDQKPSPYYSNAISVKGGRTIYIAGQTSYDEQQNFVDGSFALQVEQSMKNLKKVLHAANASTQDVVMIHLYVKNYQRNEHLDVLMDLLKKNFPGEKLPASTLIGVQSLAKDNMLFEIEAIAVIPD